MNLLITGAWASAREHISELETMGHRVSFLQQERDALPVPADWVEGILGNGIFLYHGMERFENLQYIQLTSAGFDRVPMDYVKEHSISIFNARGVYSVPMAEFAVAGVLSLYKQMRVFAQHQEKHLGEKCRDLMELSGKTVCIVGCGSVGTECARRFAAFGCHTLGVDLFPYESPAYGQMLPLERLDSVLPQCDVLVLTLPLTAETRHLMNGKRLKMLKDTAILVNIARGAVVDQKAMEASVGRLGGAVLDVFEEEPLNPDSPLWDAENVIITPHISFVGEHNQERLSGVILKNLESVK